MFVVFLEGRYPHLYESACLRREVTSYHAQDEFRGGTVDAIFKALALICTFEKSV